MLSEGMRSRGTLWQLALGAFAITLGVAPTLACSPASESTDTHSGDALTLANGDRYVVSADPKSGVVVLRTSVEGVPLPYDEKKMVGKAMLIHPLADRAEHGLFARVTDARTNRVHERLELTTTPLTLEEMSALREDELLRIYLASTRSGVALQNVRPLSEETSSTTTSSFGGWSGALAGGFPSVWLVAPTPGTVAFVGSVGFPKTPSLGLEPEGKIAFERGTGLEVGLRGKLAPKIAIEMHGVAGARVPIFVTPEVQTPPLTVLVPIGPVPVPVQLALSGSMRCDMIAGGRIDGILSVSAEVHFGGSAHFNPHHDTDPSEWVTPGEWPYELASRLDVKVDGKLGAGVGFICIAPRVNLDVTVAGMTGPYVALVPTINALEDHVEVRPSLRAGWSARTMLFGSPARAEFELLGTVLTHPRTNR